MTHRLSSAGLIALTLAVALSACSSGSKLANMGQSKSDVLPARHGDNVHALVLEAGTLRTRSIWELCRWHIGTANTCWVNAGQRLAIGPNTAVMAAAGLPANFDPLQWELYLDDHPIDLSSFDTLRLTHYRKGFNGQSEVFGFDQAWNVAISPLSGQHTLRSVLRIDLPPDSTSDAGPAPITWGLSFAVGK